MTRADVVTAAHGAGGTASDRLVREIFIDAFGHGDLDDGAFVDAPSTGRLVVTTDGFVVRPRFFPGGCIGDLAVHGTVNDLASMGAEPQALTAGFVLEEGLPLDELRRIADAMATAAAGVGVPIVAGDTKVVGRGEADGCYITTTGIGTTTWARTAPQVGDAVICSGPMGDHGIAVLLARGDLHLSGDVASDTGPIGPAVRALLDAVPDTRRLRDATRGGVATVLCEFCDEADAGGVGIELDERSLPVRPVVAGACELLGLDPLYVACEGRFVAIVPGGSVSRALGAIGEDAAMIGSVNAEGRVTVRTRFGGRRIVAKLAGAPLPRIC